MLGRFNERKEFEMERNHETNELIVSRSELGDCLLTADIAIVGDDFAVGAVERFFEDLRDPEWNGTLRATKDGRLALNEGAEALLRSILAADDLILEVIATDAFIAEEIGCTNLADIKAAQALGRSLQRELSATHIHITQQEMTQE